MRGPKPSIITLTEAERRSLQRLTCRHTTPQQLALRARPILAAADGLNTMLGLPARKRSARRYRAPLANPLARGLRPIALTELSVEERLADAPRSGKKPPTITDEQLCRIVALACEAPGRSGRPIGQWSGREIAEEIERRGIVARISGRHAARLLKKRGISQAAPNPLLADPAHRRGRAIRGQGGGRCWCYLS